MNATMSKLKQAWPYASKSPPARPCAPSMLPAPNRSVRCNFREGQRPSSSSTPGTLGKPRKASSYYAGRSDDPMESLKEGWRSLQDWWAQWPAEDRNRTLGYSAGALLVLYITNSLLDSLERVPLVPGFLQLVGFAFSTWVFFRYLLFADGRADLARDFTIEKLLAPPHSATTDRIDDLAQRAARAASNGQQRLSDFNRSGGNIDGITTGGSVGTGRDASYSAAGGSKLSDGGKSGAGGYAGDELDSSIQNALHDLDQLADDLGPDKS